MKKLYNINGNTVSEDVFTAQEALIEQINEKELEAVAAVEELKLLVSGKLVCKAVTEDSSFMTEQELGLLDFGFHNLHTTNENDGKGDGKWYPFNAGKTRHTGDTIMSRQQAVLDGIEIG